MDRARAAEEFAQVTYQSGFIGGVEVVEEMLQAPRAIDGAEWQELSELYAGMTPAQQSLIKFLIRQTARVSLEGFLVQLDGAAGYHWVGEQPAEFAVSMRLFPDIEAVGEVGDAEIVEVCPNHGGDDLHDLFWHLVHGAADQTGPGTA